MIHILYHILQRVISKVKNWGSSFVIMKLLVWFIRQECSCKTQDTWCKVIYNKAVILQKGVSDCFIVNEEGSSVLSFNSRIIWWSGWSEPLLSNIQLELVSLNKTSWKIEMIEILFWIHFQILLSQCYDIVGYQNNSHFDQTWHDIKKTCTFMQYINCYYEFYVDNYVIVNGVPSMKMLLIFIN